LAGELSALLYHPTACATNTVPPCTLWFWLIKPAVADSILSRTWCVNLCTRRLNISSGAVTAFAGSGAEPAASADDIPATGIPASSVALNKPTSVTISPAGVAVISDTMHHRLIAVDLQTSEATVLAGTGVPGYSGDGDLAVTASLNGPMKTIFDRQGNLYFADFGSNVSHPQRALAISLQPSLVAWPDVYLQFAGTFTVPLHDINDVSSPSCP
jgi:hypothetical protein